MPVQLNKRPATLKNQQKVLQFYEALLKLNDSDIWLQKGVLGAFTFKYNDGTATKCPPS